MCINNMLADVLVMTMAMLIMFTLFPPPAAQFGTVSSGPDQTIKKQNINMTNAAADDVAFYRSFCSTETVRNGCASVEKGAKHENFCNTMSALCETEYKKNK